MKPIYEYNDYRKFIKDTILSKNEKGRHYSFAQLARKGQIKSKAHIKLVCDGQRNLTHKTIPNFARMLGLKTKESFYFENLVYFNQTKEIETQEKYKERLKNLAKTTPVKQIAFENFDFFSKWYYVVLRELVDVAGFQEDPKWVNQRLKTKLTPTEIKTTFETLIRFGFLKRKNGTLTQTIPKVSSSDTLRSKALRSFHYQMLEFAKQALNEDLLERETSGLTIALTEKEFFEVKEALIEFRKQLNQQLNQDSIGEKKRVYHIALTCFGITKEEEQK